MKPDKTNPLVLGIGALLLLSGAFATAHIVPPEKYHPVAEAHRRLTFLLNLNPILWEQARTDIHAIASALDEISKEDGAAYRHEVEEAFARMEVEAAVSSPTPTMRKETARRIFEASTEAVAKALNLHLEAARNSLGDFDEAAQALDTARQIWAAFEYEVRATDPIMFRDLGGRWLACSSALGSPGILGVGSQAADTEIFYSESRHIEDYVEANFGHPYNAPEWGRFAPLPTGSPSFDRRAKVAPKLPPGRDMNKQLPRPRQVLNMAERGVDESETVLIALGDMIFDSPYVFGEPARSLLLSCNTCHNKGVTNPGFFVPGISSREGGMDVSNSFFAPHANNGFFDHVDIPDLRGIRFTAPYGRNGRIASLREFVRNVIMHEFNGPEPAPIVLDSLIAYMNEFDFLPNEYLNPDGALNEKASALAKKGEKIFHRPFPQMGNKSCATCHVPSNHFRDGKQHDIGSVSGSGVYGVDGAMETPTLLSSAYTQPYFHDGSLATLGDVARWFERQYELGLSAPDLDALTAYLEAVGHGDDAYEDTVFTLESEMEEFKFFLSSYEYIKGLRNSTLLETLFQTIATEIHAHKWDVQDPGQMPVLNRLAKLMDDAYHSAAAGTESDTDRIVDEYRKTYAAYAAVLK